MTGLERIQCVLAGEKPDRNAFWIGDVHRDAQAFYYKYFDVKNEVELAKKTGSDLVWRHADKGAWRPPNGDLLFGEIINSTRDRSYAWLAECEDAAEVEKAAMPDLDYFDFTELEALADTTHKENKAFVSGMWAPFFHIVADSFGMENYFIKMHECPEVVHALTDKVVAFYMAANERCFEKMHKKIDAYFFGNDVGTQRGPIISPDFFRIFLLPGIRKIVDQAKSYGLPVMMHSCGSIECLITDLISAGIDVIHPIQAKAEGMEATLLRHKYPDQVFMGGVDAQDLLTFGTPEQVAEEVQRLCRLFGPKLIISPSHEKIMDNMPPENIVAMAHSVGAI